MRLGIDFGTTRVAVAFVDAGNYPVVVFETPEGETRDWFPPLVAIRDSRRLFGWEAWAVQEKPGWTLIRSIKRLLGAASLSSQVEIAGQLIPLRELLVGICSSLHQNLLKHSNLPIEKSEPFEVMLGVPANANSNQRFLTTDMFRSAGFEVLGLLNEPSAASIEFGHRRPESSRQREEHVLVYDLGGGTFDASLVTLGEREHTVAASEGIESLGGDDFDEFLAELALEAAGVAAAERDSLSQMELFHLHEECREKKEALHPNTRYIHVDLGKVRAGWSPVTVTTADFYQRCRPAVDETIHAVCDLMESHGLGLAASGGGPRIDTLYVTGGASELPLVSRVLREVFGRVVRRSAYTRFASAIGLAIQADSEAGYQLRDRFTRYFGVWREGEAGRTAVFDPLFRKGAALPAPSEPPLAQQRGYSAVHNIGHFRYLECAQLSGDGCPAGDIMAWGDILFPFDPALRDLPELSGVPVARTPFAAQNIEEHYSCDSNGAVVVRITNLSSGYQREYRLGRWDVLHPRVVPGRSPRRRRARPSG
jgi:molecular chaperone DnaK (HSP70)